MEEVFVKRALGIDRERLTEGLVFKKRREWAELLRRKERELKKFLTEHGGSILPRAGYAQWKYLRERTGPVIETPEDIVASAERLEALLKRQLPKAIPSRQELERLALEYGALREVREALEKADDAKILNWYLKKGPFLDLVAPFIVLEAKQQGLDHRRVAELIVRAVKEGEV